MVISGFYYLAAAPIPVSIEWVPALLMTIVWIFVAAAVAGPVVRHLRRGR
jgi:hypothetical protein